MNSIFSTWCIVGSRDIQLPVKAITQAIRRTFYAFDVPPVDHLITGDARGVDALVRRWAELQLPTKAEWEKGVTGGQVIGCDAFTAYWDSEGRRAGYLRNQRMAKTRPDVTIAITSDVVPSRGTAMMMRLVHRAKLPLVWFVVGEGQLRAKGMWNIDYRMDPHEMAEAMIPTQPREKAASPRQHTTEGSV